MTFSHDVTEDVFSGVELFLAAVAAILVDLPPDEVHQFDLLIELKI